MPCRSWRRRSSATSSLSRVTRQAQERITDPAAREEAELFLKQEAIHARAHRNHTAALVAQYPGLAEVLDEANARYDRLLETEPLEHHLAYVADVEATFTPLFRMMLDNESVLFRGGDDRVASLLLWHFVEEIEHRASALTVYRAVVRGDWYRLRRLPAVFGHVLGIAQVVFDGFNEHVPFEDRLVDAPSRAGEGSWAKQVFLGDRADNAAYREVPNRELWRMTAGLVRSQLPRHRPTREVTPRFADRWFEAYDRGVDVTRWYATSDHREPCEVQG
jgi:hypothetical protein